MKRVINFVKGKKDDRKDKVVSNICVEITNPLGQKVPSEDEHIVGLQMGYGYDLDMSGRDRSMTKLHKAAWQGNLDKLKLHLKKFDINVTDEFNRTPLHLAAAQGHSHVVCFLLDNKAVPDICDSDGMTPFLKAVECGIRECVSVLIEKGVQTSTTDNHGNTALHITARQGFFNIMSMLLKQAPNCDCANNAGEMPLHIATEQEHRDLVELLLQAKAHVNVVDRDNRTPLMLAARVGQASIVSLLLKYGASLDACDNNGWTAEDYAMIGGNEQLALELRVPQVTPSQLISESEAELECEETEEPNNNTEPAQEISVKDPNENEVSVISIKKDDNSEEKTKPTIKSPPYSALAGEDEAQESPRSCVTPPPLNPPRSWEMIQAGMIDQTQVRRRSLMALGTLESHRESFIENGNSHEASDLNFPPSPPMNLEVHEAKVDSDTEWDSEDSLPLDRSLPLPPPPDSLPPPPDSLTPDCSLPPVPELIITPDRRSRSRNNLERTPSLDLTDSDPFQRDAASCNVNKETEEASRKEKSAKEEEDTWDSIIVSKTDEYVSSNPIKEDQRLSIAIPDTGEQKTTQLTVEEEADDIKISTFHIVLTEIKGNVRESYSLDNLDECGSKCSEIESSQSCERLESGVHSSNLESSINEIDFTQSLDSLEEESLMGTVVKRNTFLESHSLELLEEPKRPLRHSRNKSMSASSSFNWSRSADVLSKPSNSEAQSLNSKRIDAQLKCYDEALRELAEEQRVKEDLLNQALESNPFTRFNMNQSASCDEIEPRTSGNHRRSCSSNQIGCGGSQAQRNGETSNSFDIPSSSREGYKQFRKATTMDSFVPQFSVQDKEEMLKSSDVSVKSSIANQSSHDANTGGNYQDVASSSNYSSLKTKPNKHRSSSVSSRDKKGAGESKLKFYNSLELPPRPKKGKDKPPPANSGNKSSYVTETRVTGLKLILKNNSNQPKGVPKAPPRPKKSLKKEMSDGDIETGCEAKGAVRKGIARSASMFTERSKAADANRLVINNDHVCDKSDTDSEWSDRPLKSKRKQFVAMRGVAADSDSNEEDPPFWLSTGKDGCFSRQDTVIYNHNANGMKKNGDVEKLGEEGQEEGSSSSETASVSLSHSEDSPSQIFPLKGHQSLLKEHLKQATDEKGRLEELTAKLREQTERLQYDLADAHQSIVARDDKIIILQDELSRLSTKYSSSLDELNSLKQSLTTAEIELNHLRELTRVNSQKESSKSELNSQHVVRQLQEANKSRKRLEFEKETLIAQHIMDIEKLQQDTIHWKDLYEDAVSKLEQIEALYDPCLIENNQHLEKVKSFFKKFRDEKTRQCKLKSSSTSDSNLIENRSPNIDRSKAKTESKSDCFKDSVVDNQVATLKLQLQQEKSKSSALETQVQKMLLDLQKKIDLELELENLNHRLKKDFVPKIELDQLRANQETVIGRIRQQALLESETKLNVKLAEINQILQLQLQEQSQKERQRELADTQMKQEFENTRQKLLIELSRVQAALKAKESEERVLREQCESMVREAERAQDRKRAELIRKSYSVNLVDTHTTREKELMTKPSVIPPPPPPPPLAPPPLDVNMYTVHSLRQQLERTISKHRDIQLSLASEDLPSPPGRSQH